jgi:hypothetical protein
LLPVPADSWLGWPVRDLVAADAENAVPRTRTAVIAIFTLANMIPSWQWFEMLNSYGETAIPAELFPSGEKSAAFFAGLSWHDLPIMSK